MDSLYRINPYTGRSAPLDVRHALALFPIWEAFIAGMSGIHPVIVMHSVMPLLLIPLTYLLYFRIGKELFGRKRIMLPVFMILMALFQIFGNVSVYTNETFFLTRTWQGKSVAGNFILPAVFWIFLNLFDDNWDEWPGHVLTAGLGLLFAVRYRKFGVLVRAGLACVPGAAYVLTYLVIR